MLLSFFDALLLAGGALLLAWVLLVLALTVRGVWMDRRVDRE